MPIKTAMPNLGAFLKRDTMPRFFVQGKGAIQLGVSDFKAQGGEGAIYVKGSTAYKIYANPRRTISREKIVELSVLDHPNIIRPLDLILDRRNRPAGYSMRYVGRSYALCQLFPRAFRSRNRITPEVTLSQVRKLQEGIKHVHSKGVLIVDLNELNFLVSEDFNDLFFIDVDSYQTPSYPATSLMESVRDRFALTFTVNSDWFSFAVVSFQMFVGIHPFKGTYPPLQNIADKERKLDTRMRANVSVLHAGVSVPTSCLPFSLIPPNYLDWYKAVFEEGKRLPPPDSVPGTVVVSAPAARGINPDISCFETTEIAKFDSEIIRYDGVITVTQQSIHFDGHEYPRPQFDGQVVVTPRLRYLVAASRQGTKLTFRNLTLGQNIDFEMEVEELMTSEGQLYLKQQENVFVLEFVELKQKILVGIRQVANATMRSTRMFEGLAIQNLLGAKYATIPATPRICHQVHLPELEEYQILEARLERGVLMVIGTKQGQYDLLIFRFAVDFGSYDVRVVQRVSSSSINFTVLDSGVVLRITDDDCLEIFSRGKGSSNIRLIQDSAVQGDARLFHVGAQALIARGNRLYKIKMRSETSSAGVY